MPRASMNEHRAGGSADDLDIVEAQHSNGAMGQELSV